MTARKHTRFYHDIWGDDDWRDLSPEAQHLYFVLYTWPPTFCGAGDWKPRKIMARAKGWEEATVLDAAEELVAGEFVLLDLETEEHLLRSWIKHDGLYRNANMAVSVANAWTLLASRNLRGVVVHEVSKLRKAEPKLESWTRDQVVKMLSQKSIEPAKVDWSSPWDSPSVSPSVRAKVRAKGTRLPCTCDRARATPLLRSTTPSTPNSNSSSGYVSTEGTERPHCTTHPYSNSKDACGDCQLRREWDEAQAEALAEQKRQRRKVVEECTDCDDFGRRDDLSLCPRHPSLKDPIAEPHQEAVSE